METEFIAAKSQRMVHIHSAHPLLPYSSMVFLNIIFPFSPGSSKWSLPFRSFDQNCTLNRVENKD
jgi:hypothetical protein